MNYERAKEILHSSETIEVLYNGSPIWIEGLDDTNQTASISSDQLNEKPTKVSVEELQEGTHNH
ncbi:MAG: H-type small acid-soluble spore protein [Bacilli bacterium]